MKVNTQNVLSYIIILLIFYPTFFSVVFGIFNLDIPSYLFSMIITLPLLFLLINRKIYITNFFPKVLFYLFFCWIYIGSLYSISVIASKEIILNITYTIIAPTLIIGLSFDFVKDKKFQIHNLEEKLVRNSKYLAIIFLFFILLFKEIQNDRIVLPGLENPIWLTRFIGFLSLILFYNWKKNLHNKLLFIICLIMMVFVGSRTPFIALLICIFIINLKQNALWKNLLFLIVGLLTILGFSLIFSDSYLFQGGIASYIHRVNFFNLIKESNFNYLLGEGTGSYGIYFKGIDEVAYPHNIFLEVFFENGLIGVTLLILLIVYFIINYRPMLINICVIFFFLNSLMSGNINGNNLLYICLFISICITNTRK